MDTSLLSKPHVHATIPGVSKMGYTYLKLKQQVLVLFKSSRKYKSIPNPVHKSDWFLSGKTHTNNLHVLDWLKHILTIYMLLTD